jgi:hypothetical protein
MADIIVKNMGADSWRFDWSTIGSVKDIIVG